MKPEELAERIERNPFAAQREKLMQKVTLIALRNSQPLTPVRTGTLRRSETTRVEQGGLQGFIGSNVVYAPFVHARVPFFEQGIEASRPAIEDALKQMGDGWFGEIVK